MHLPCVVPSFAELSAPGKVRADGGFEQVWFARLGDLEMGTNTPDGRSGVGAVADGSDALVGRLPGVAHEWPTTKSDSGMCAFST